MVQTNQLLFDIFVFWCEDLLEINFAPVKEDALTTINKETTMLFTARAWYNLIIWEPLFGYEIYSKKFVVQPTAMSCWENPLNSDLLDS